MPSIAVYPQIRAFEPSDMPENVLIIGGSRHIGYYSAVRLLASGSNVTFLLRSAAVFDNDETIQEYVKRDKAHLIQGDALVEEDVKRAWNEATADAPIDLLLFTVGFTGTPSFHPFKGFTIFPANLVSQALLNVLCCMPRTPTPPKIIVLSTSGVSRSSRASVPFLLRPLYAYLIGPALKDKLGVERIMAHCAGWKWNTMDGEPDANILGIGWKEREGLPEAGSLKDVMVVRPALLTDGDCLADRVEAAGSGSRAAYRAGPGEVRGWTVSRRDVAHFIVDAVSNKWEEYGKRQVSVAY